MKHEETHHGLFLQTADLFHEPQRDLIHRLPHRIILVADQVEDCYTDE